jgi:hypothetical protein
VETRGSGKRKRRTSEEMRMDGVNDLADKVANLGLLDLKTFRSRLSEMNETALKLLAGESVKLD